MKRTGLVIMLLSVSNLALVGVLAWFLYNSGASTKARDEQERTREKAASLVARGLYGAAISEYGRLIDDATLTREEEADILYKMALLADENMNDCERALPYYTMATALAPDAEWSSKAGRGSIACMEKLGRSRQAQALLNQLTSPGEEKNDIYAGPTVAVIDGRSVKWGEVEAAMYPLSGGTASRERNIGMVHEYVFTLVTAAEAEKQGFDKGDGMKAAIEFAGKRALSAAYLKARLEEADEEMVRSDIAGKVYKVHEVRVFNEAVPAP